MKKLFFCIFLITNLCFANELPDLGDYSETIIGAHEEAVIGSQILQQVQQSNTVIHDVEIEDFQEVEKMTVILTKNGDMKVFKDHLEYKKIKSNLDNIISFRKIMSNQKILLFVTSGRVYTIDPNNLPSGNSKAKNFIFFVESNINDKAINILPYSENLKCVLATLFGKGFIADLNEIKTTQKKGKQLFNLKTGDKLLTIANKINSHIACVNNKSKLIIFQTKYLPILKKGGGVQLQKMKKDDKLSDIQTFNLSDGIYWKIGKHLRNEKKINFWLGKRSQSGKKVPKRFNKDLKFYNE